MFDVGSPQQHAGRCALSRAAFSAGKSGNEPTELADALGVSLGATNYCLSALIDRGFVKLGNFSTSEDKRRYAYILTPKGLTEKAALTGRFLKRKREEYKALKAEIEALQAEMEPADESGNKQSVGQ